VGSKIPPLTIVGPLIFVLFSGLAIAAEEKPGEEDSAMEQAEEAGSAASNPTARVGRQNV
jgi:hypothetical protein